MGPIDYLLIEWPERQPRGEAAPHLIDLVERGIIRILDLSFFHKDEDGGVSVIALADVEVIAGFEELVGASSGLLSQDITGELKDPDFLVTCLECDKIAPAESSDFSTAAPASSAQRFAIRRASSPRRERSRRN